MPYISKTILLFSLQLLSLSLFPQQNPIDPSDDYALDPLHYQFDGHFYDSNPNTPFRANRINNIVLFEDPSKAATVESIYNNTDSLIWRNWQNTQPQPGKVYWINTRLFGSNIFNGEQILRISTSSEVWGYYSFDKIETYIMDGHGRHTYQKAGDQMPLKDRPYYFWANFIKVDIDPTDTLDLFIRMEGADHRIQMSRIELSHIDPTSLFPQQVNEAWKNGLFYGILGVQVLYFLLLFFIEKERIHLYLTFATMGLFLAIGFSDGNFDRFVPFPFWSSYDFFLFFFGTFLAQAGALKYTETYFNYTKASLFSNRIIPVFIALSALVNLSLFLTWEHSSSFEFLKSPISYFFYLLLIGSPVLILLMVVNVKKQKTVSRKIFLLAFLPIILTVLLTFMRIFGFHALGVNFSDPVWTAHFLRDLIKWSIVWMLTLLALSTGNRTNRLKAEKEEALRKNLADQKQINQAISRFVPNEFLRSLGKTNITEIALGDNTQREVTIFFSDIRDYTALSEQMNPEDNFNFVNAYNGRMGPIIQQNKGFVNQYLGDGIMAIFPESPTDALRAAIKMQQAINAYNLQRIKEGRKAIRVGMGLHTGSLIMGITGDADRLDATTISDSVNSASRIENLSKHYGTSILLSEACLEKLHDKNEFNLRYLGQVQVKGKQRALKIYECFDGDLLEIISLKLTTLTEFEAGVKYYLEKAFAEAAVEFEAVLKRNPIDPTAQLFLNKAERLISEGVDESWTGVEMMDKK